MRRTVLAVAVGALALAACGGDDHSDPATNVRVRVALSCLAVGETGSQAWLECMDA